jgi:hypothetical protein
LRIPRQAKPAYRRETEARSGRVSLTATAQADGTKGFRRKPPTSLVGRDLRLNAAPVG